MLDERTRHLRKLRRARRTARRWTVVAGAATAAAGVLIPYQGIGPWDAVWAAVAGGSLAMSGWRWSDLRALSAQPVPERVEPSGEPWLAALSHLPAGRTLATRIHHHRTRFALRGSPGSLLWERLERAGRTMRELSGRLRDGDAEALREAAGVERQLRQLTDRLTGLEQALRTAPEEARPPLRELRADHLRQLEQGVQAYEQFVAAAAGYVSEADRAGGSEQPGADLGAATDRLRGVTAGLAELRTRHGDLPASG